VGDAAERSAPGRGATRGTAADVPTPRVPAATVVMRHHARIFISTMFHRTTCNVH
jgi:hypothetical protein